MTLYSLATLRTNNFTDKNVATHIQNLWQTTLQQCTKPLPILYGVYHQYESNYKGDYSLTIATENPQDGAPLSDTFQDNYAIFHVDTTKELGIFEAWQDIWRLEEEGKLNRCYSADFEKYLLDGAIEIHIAINK